jgi:hypothetical protein
MLVNLAAGGYIIQMEPDEALRFFDRLAAQEQWMNHNRRRGGGSGRIKFDKFSVLLARLDTPQKQLKQSKEVKAVVNIQPTSCDLYRDEGHDYLEYSLTQPDEGTGPVNLVNNEPSFMSSPLYEHSFMSNSLYEP